MYTEPKEFQNISDEDFNDLETENLEPELESELEEMESSLDIQTIEELVKLEQEEENKEEEKAPIKESKHKIKGKHALAHDAIFKGKKKVGENQEEDEYSTDFLVPKQENFDFDTSSSYHEETKDPEEYNRLKNLKEEIYLIIVEKTDINIKSPRRKPARVDFNSYYHVLVDNLDTTTYSYGEIFIELSFYFSDNIFNMFKLLDKKWGGKVITELAKKRNIKIDQMDFL